MIRSMTGFGSASEDVDGVRYSIEIRTVNSKYFKPVVRAPEGFEDIEPPVEELIRQHVQRGTVTVTASRTETSASEAFQVNRAALRRYLEQIHDVEMPGGMHATIDISALLALPGVLTPAPDGDARHERARQTFLRLVGEGIRSLLEMRDVEGRSLHAELSSQIAGVRERLKEIERLAPGVVGQYQERLRARIESLLTESGIKAESPDIVREVASYAERTDIHEEISRLSAHLDQFDGLIGSDEVRPVGRTLDFLAQELLREANTIASKTPDAQVSRLVIEIKGAIDRVKELVQNVE